ncbi:MAG TPA: hypothetical protein VJX66_15420, partial [Amycolatopsis sp.]|nr:hypothetical protein [Amycolatopsis sp.]
TTTSGAISVGGTQIKYSGSVYLDRPLIALRHADAAARADLTVRARLSLGPVEVTSVVQATALVPIRLGPATPDWSAPLYLDLSTLTLQSARISSATVDGQPLPPAALSDQLTAALVDAIRPLAGDRLRFAVPLTALSDMQFAAAEAGAVVPALRPVAVVVLEQSVVACFDCVGPFDDWHTQGDPAQIGQPWDTIAQQANVQDQMVGRQPWHKPDDVNLAVSFAPKLVTAAMAQSLKLQLTTKPPYDGLIVTGVQASAQAGQVALHATMNVPAPAPFTDRVYITIDTTVVPIGDLLYLTRDDVDLDANWILTLLDAIKGMWDGTVESMIQGRITGLFRDANMAIANIARGGYLPGLADLPGKPGFGIKIEAAAADPTYFVTGANVLIAGTSARSLGRNCIDDPAFLPGMTLPPDHAWPVPVSLQHYVPNPDWDELIPQKKPSPAGFSAVNIRFPDVSVSLDLVHPLVRRDPTLRLRWTVTAKEPGGRTSVPVRTEGWAIDPASRKLSINLWDPRLYVADELDVKLEYIRPPGEVVTTSLGEIQIGDRFLRAQPYVRWKHTLNWVTKEGVFGTTKRASVVHRTDVRQRCLFCDTGNNRGFDFQYFDALPVPEQDGYRTKLCPYCFS